MFVPGLVEMMRLSLCGGGGDGRFVVVVQLSDLDDYVRTVRWLD